MSRISGGTETGNGWCKNTVENHCNSLIASGLLSDTNPAASTAICKAGTTADLE